MLETPDIQKTKIDRLSSLTFRVSSYISRGTAKLCESETRSGIANVSATQDQLLLSLGCEGQLPVVNRANNQDRTSQ